MPDRSTLNSSSMKLNNMLQIINIVRKNRVSRAEVARITGLTRAAVTIIVDRLEREGILVESGMGESEGTGRKPILLDINADCFTFIGVDVSRMGCSLGVVDIKGGILESERFPLAADTSFQAMVSRLRTGMQRMGERAKQRPGRLAGIGITAPGPLDANTGRVFNPPNFPLLHGVNLVEELGEGFGFGAFLDNNSIARTLYEKNLGAGRRLQNYLVMTVDSGVGAGLVLNDRLYRGSGFATEMGHASIDMHGPPCACGNRGCLERYASIPALLERECRGRPDLSSWEAIVDGAEAGDSFCTDVIDREAGYLALGIVNAANLLDLQAVILSGFVAYHPAMLLERIRKYVSEARIARNIHDIEIRSAEGSAGASVAYAATIAMERFFTGESGWAPQPAPEN